MDINFELYKVFFHAASTGSFSHAARNLFITQSAVSQAVRNLEKKLGCRLFFRKKRSISLTGEGEILLKHVEQAYNLIKTAESKLEEIQNLNSGEVKIGAGDTISKYCLIPYLENYNMKYPGIKIQVINRTSPQILNMLKNGMVDIGIVTLPVEDQAITTSVFTTVQDVFVASDRFLNLKGRSVTLEELMQYPLLLLKESSSTRRNLDKFFNSRGLRVSPEIELESEDLLAEFAGIGMGIACVMEPRALPEIKKGRLFKLETEEALPPRELGICVLKNVPLSRASLRLIEILKS